MKASNLLGVCLSLVLGICILSAQARNAPKKFQPAAVHSPANNTMRNHHRIAHNVTHNQGKPQFNHSLPMNATKVHSLNITHTPLVRVNLTKVNSPNIWSQPAALGKLNQTGIHSGPGSGQWVQQNRTQSSGPWVSYEWHAGNQTLPQSNLTSSYAMRYNRTFVPAQYFDGHGLSSQPQNWHFNSSTTIIGGNHMPKLNASMSSNWPPGFPAGFPMLNASHGHGWHFNNGSHLNGSHAQSVHFNSSTGFMIGNNLTPLNASQSGQAWPNFNYSQIFVNASHGPAMPIANNSAAALSPGFSFNPQMFSGNWAGGLTPPAGQALPASSASNLFGNAQLNPLLYDINYQPASADSKKPAAAQLAPLQPVPKTP